MLKKITRNAPLPRAVLVWLCGGLISMSSAAAQPITAEANRVAEVPLVSEKTYQNPFLEIELDAVVNGTLTLLTSACAKKPAMPVLCGETCYEGLMQQGFGTVQRHVFWRNMLSGAAGHTYGAAGIWHAGVDGDHGNWGAWDRQPYDWTTWKEGMKYPGSTQLGLAKKLLENIRGRVSSRTRNGRPAVMPPAFPARCGLSICRGATSTTGMARR